MSIAEKPLIEVLQESALNQYVLHWENHLNNLGVNDEMFRKQIISTACIGFKDGWSEFKACLDAMAKKQEEETKPQLII